MSINANNTYCLNWNETNGDQSEEDCCICLQQLNSNPAFVHGEGETAAKIHRSCLQDLILRSRNRHEPPCPLCRKRLSIETLLSFSPATDARLFSEILPLVTGDLESEDARATLAEEWVYHLLFQITNFDPTSSSYTPAELREWEYAVDLLVRIQADPRDLREAIQRPANWALIMNDLDGEDPFLRNALLTFWGRRLLVQITDCSHPIGAIIDTASQEFNYAARLLAEVAGETNDLHSTAERMIRGLNHPAFKWVLLGAAMDYLDNQDPRRAQLTAQWMRELNSFNATGENSLGNESGGQRDPSSLRYYFDRS